MTYSTICFTSLTAYGYFEEEAPAGGGAERQLYLLSQELRDSFDVHFIVGDYGQPPIQHRDGITLHRAYSPGPESAPVRQGHQLLKLFTAMRRSDADVYVHRGGPRKAAISYLLTQVLQAKWVYNVANDPNVDEQPDALSPPIRWLFGQALRDAAGIIAQTDYQARRLRERYGVESTVVPNGYPTPETVVEHENREHFLWVGRLDERQKRPHLYLDLAEQLPSKKFLLVGPSGLDQQYANHIRRRAASLKNVEDIGRVDPDEIHQYYREAIALINTSRAEGFPNTFLEAWRYDTPVLSLDVNPNRFVDPGINGYAEGEVTKLCELAARLWEDCSYRAEMGTAAGEFVRSELAIDAVAQAYGDVLRKAIRGK